MPPASDPDLLVLHGLRLKAIAPPAAVAELFGLAEGDVAERLERLAASTWVVHRHLPFAGWSLTPTGRREGSRLLAAELEVTGTRAAVDSAYRSLLEHNQRFLRVCTDWQLRPVEGDDGTQPMPNDHGDAAHDHRVLADLRTLDRAVRLICADLAHALARFGRYGERFGKALRHVEAGETDWFTRPVLDSYHTVWFELHEDLLATLGLERASERAS